MDWERYYLVEASDRLDPEQLAALKRRILRGRIRGTDAPQCGRVFSEKEVRIAIEEVALTLAPGATQTFAKSVASKTLARLSQEKWEGS